MFRIITLISLSLLMTACHDLASNSSKVDLDSNQLLGKTFRTQGVKGKLSAADAKKFAASIYGRSQIHAMGIVEIPISNVIAKYGIGDWAQLPPETNVYVLELRGRLVWPFPSENADEHGKPRDLIASTSIVVINPDTYSVIAAKID